MVTDALRDKLKATLVKVKEDAPILAALQELPGIGPALAERVLRHFGRNFVLDIVRDNPFRLTEVRGIGFRIADGTAAANDFPPDHDARIDAGIVYAVQSACDESGDCYVTQADAKRLAMELLAVTPDLIARGMARAQGIVIEPGDAVYASGILGMEERVAWNLRQLTTTPARPPAASRMSDEARTLFSYMMTSKTLAESAEEAIAAFQVTAGYALSESQAAAVRTVAEHKVVVITGGPGVGKTTVLRAIRNAFRGARVTAEYVAPTGRAAKRMAEATGANAMTIHRLLGWKGGQREFYAKNPLPTAAVVVDEVSMVSLELIDAILDAMPSTARLVLIGDVDQLPSINPGAVLRDIIDSGAVPVVRLSQVFRQAKGSKISLAAQEINAGTKPEGEKTSPGEFFIFDAKSNRDSADIVTGLVTKKLPSTFGMDPVNDVQVLCAVKKGADGAEELNRRLQDDLNPMRLCWAIPSLFGFRPGDKVISTKNNYDAGIVNGDIGFVRKLEHGDCEHRRIADVKRCKCRVVVEVDEDNLVMYCKQDIEHLDLAYALTVHKSQGCEFKAVVVPALPSRVLTRNLLYTAVTRGKGVVVLVSNDNALRGALAEAKKNNRKTRLAARLCR